MIVAIDVVLWFQRWLDAAMYFTDTPRHSPHRQQLREEMANPSIPLLSLLDFFVSPLSLTPYLG